MNRKVNKLNIPSIDWEGLNEIEQDYNARQLKYYYGQAALSKHAQYGNDYGVLDGVTGFESKTYICSWNDRLNYYDETKSDTDKVTEIEFLNSLPAHQHTRKAARFVASCTHFERIVIAYDYITRDMYNFTINCLIHGVPVYWLPRSQHEVRVKDIVKFDTYRSLLQHDELDHTYESDFPVCKGVKLPYPTIKKRALTKVQLDDYTKRVPSTLLNTVADNVVAHGYKLPVVLDKAYYKYEVSKSFLYTLKRIAPQSMKSANGEVVPAYAYLLARHFEEFMDKYVQEDKGLTELRQEYRESIKGSIVRLNDSLESYTIASMTLPNAEALEADFKTEHFILLDYVKQSEMYFEPTRLNKEFAAHGDATLFQAPNQLGYRTSWDYRDYAKNAESNNYTADAVSYHSALDTMAYNKSKDVHDVILLEAEQVKLRAAKMLEKLPIDKTEFLSDGYKVCKHCGKIYKLSDFEYSMLVDSDDPEYKLFGDWSTSGYNDAVTSEESSEVTEVVRTNPLDEHLCSECQDQLTLKTLVTVFPEFKRGAIRALNQGADKAVVMTNILKLI